MPDAALIITEAEPARDIRRMASRGGDNAPRPPIHAAEAHPANRRSARAARKAA